jgi:hypothetical protein
MTTTHNMDKLAIIGLIMTATLPFAALSPARAGTVDCVVQAEAVRTKAVTAEPAAAAKALKTVRLAEKICAEGGRAEAGRKFSLAMRQLDQSVQLADRR